MDDNYYKIGLFLSVLALTVLIGYVVNRFFIRLIRKSTEDMQTDPTNYQFLRRALVVMIYIVGFSVAIYTLPQLRTLASSLLAGAGILAVSVGFASQHALSNIIGGFFIVIFKPFKISDRLLIREMFGVVEDITLRHVVIRDMENRRIIIPNSVISEEVIVNANFSENRVCKFIDIGISYNSDIDLAKKIIEEEILNHPLNIDGRNEEQIEKDSPIVPVRVVKLGESSVDLRAWAWAKDLPDGFVLSCDVYESIKKRFDREGVEIPFPHRTVYIREEPNKNINPISWQESKTDSGKN